MSQGFTRIKPLIHSLRAPENQYNKTHTGWMQPYFVWRWKQNELFRQLYEHQMEHLRKVYRRQWFESYRINADEYLSVYSKTKAAQYQAWQEEVLKEEKKRRENNWKTQASKQLAKKQTEIWQEYSEKKFFYWYERASERLQQMNLLPWIRREDFSLHIERELDKYITEGNPTDSPSGYRGITLNHQNRKKYPLNFVGQMPFLEDKKGNIVSVSVHSKQYYDLNTKSVSATPGDSRTQKPLAEKVNVYDPGERDFLEEISTEASIIDIGPVKKDPSSNKRSKKLSIEKNSVNIPLVTTVDPNDAIGLQHITKCEGEPMEDYTDQKSARNKGPNVKPPFC